MAMCCRAVAFDDRLREGILLCLLIPFRSLRIRRRRSQLLWRFAFNVLGEAMFAAGSRSFQFGLMLATALSVSMWPAASEAYTPEQQAACSDDAFRLCSSEIPDVDRVTACMVQHKSELSAGCKAVFGPAPSAARATPTSTATATPVKASKPLSLLPPKTRRAGV